MTDSGGTTLCHPTATVIAFANARRCMALLPSPPAVLAVSLPRRADSTLYRLAVDRLLDTPDDGRSSLSRFGTLL